LSSLGIITFSIVPIRLITIFVTVELKEKLPDIVEEKFVIRSTA